MEFQIQENCLTIFLPKDVDHYQVEELRTETDRIITSKHIKHIIFDFRQTQFMDSSGIGAILGRYKLICNIGGEVWGVNANERVKKILSMSGITKIIQLYEEDVVDEVNK